MSELVLDVFRGDAFSTRSLIPYLDKTAPVFSSLISDLGLFMDVPIQTQFCAFDEVKGTLKLINSSVRGTYGSAKGATEPTRTMRSFQVPRLYEFDTITARSVAGYRKPGTTELESAREVLDEKLNGPAGLRTALRATWEYQFLGAVQGKVYDADGSTLLLDMYALTGTSEPTEINFDLTAASPSRGVLKKAIETVKSDIIKALEGMPVGGNMYPMFLCGDNFFQALVSHPEVEKYVNLASYPGIPQALRASNWGGVYSAIEFCGCLFTNYRGGTGGLSSVAINTDKCVIFPVGVPGLFKRAVAPGDEFLEFVNTNGVPEYVKVITDAERNSYIQVELYSYVMPFCQRPLALLKGRKA